MWQDGRIKAHLAMGTSQISVPSPQGRAFLVFSEAGPAAQALGQSRSAPDCNGSDVGWAGKGPGRGLLKGAECVTPRKTLAPSAERDCPRHFHLPSIKCYQR